MSALLVTLIVCASMCFGALVYHLGREWQAAKERDEG